MSNVPTLTLLGAAQLAEAYRARTLSPREVAGACLAVIEARNPGLNAFLVVDGERAMAAARASEADVARLAMDAVNAPCGLAADGLPVALQLVGARFAEATVLRASRALERARPFPRVPGHA